MSQDKNTFFSQYIQFDTSKEFIYHWCGKFTSPNDEWIHLTRNLTDYELMVVTKGVLYIGDHEKEYAISAGQYLLMPPTPYQHGTRSAGCSFYWLHFGYHQEKQDHTLASLDASPRDLTNPTATLSIPLKGTLPSLDRIKIMMKQIQDSDRRYKDATLNRYLCGALLAELSLQLHSPACDPAILRTGTLLSREQLLEEIATYIRWHIQENLLVSQIADYFGYNEKYLTTLFKKYYGISLKQFLLQTKMEHAKASLSESSLPVSHIAYSLGFADAHNFSNAFRKVTGLSPSEYRSTYSKQNVFQV